MPQGIGYLKDSAKKQKKKKAAKTLADRIGFSGKSKEDTRKKLRERK